MSAQEVKAIIALEDGRVFEGKAFGARGERYGEIVFNTSMTGYQEILTDPSYKGQIVTMTYPLIGNYGVNRQDVESWCPHVAGFVIRELSPVVSNWRALAGSLPTASLKLALCSSFSSQRNAAGCVTSFT